MVLKKIIYCILVILCFSSLVMAHGGVEEDHVELLEPVDEMSHEETSNYLTLHLISSPFPHKLLELFILMALICFIWKGLKRKLFLIFAAILIFYIVFSHLPPMDHSMDMAELNANVNLHSSPKTVQPEMQTLLVFDIKSENGEILKLMKHHGRKVHVVIIGEDLNTFGHIHPEDFGLTHEDEGLYSVLYDFPRSGKYLVAIDIMSEDGVHSETFTIDVVGENRMNKPVVDLRRFKDSPAYFEHGDDKYLDPVFLDQKGDELYEVYLETEGMLKSNHETKLKLHFNKNGQEIKDMSLFLEAPIHFAIVKEDLSEFMHKHGVPLGFAEHNGHSAVQVDSLGPSFELSLQFPSPGFYNVFSQAKHEDKIIFSKFVIEIK